MKHLKKYKKYQSRFKKYDYVKWGNSNKIFQIIKIDKKSKLVCIKEQTGTKYGGTYWINENEILPATEIEINTLKYNL